MADCGTLKLYGEFLRDKKNNSYLQNLLTIYWNFSKIIAFLTFYSFSL